jgi:hypothetical protein
VRWGGLRGKTGSKFSNIPTRVDGVTFHSKLEAGRYQELKAMQQAGLIRDLELQPRFRLEVNGVEVCTYVADFRYVDVQSGETVVEDAKGVVTDVYRMKARLMVACLGIEVQEVRRVRGFRR